MAYDCKDLQPSYNGECEVCGQSPTVPMSGMCGPCTFGESDTIDGEWGRTVAERCENCKCPEIAEEF